MSNGSSFVLGLLLTQRHQYINIVEGVFKGPPLMSGKGRIIWGISVIFFWGAAFCIGAPATLGRYLGIWLTPLLRPGSGIPSVGTLSGLVAAICIFQFSYTFPPLFQLALEMHKDAMVADDAFETPGVAPRRIDTWKSWVSLGGTSRSRDRT